MRNDCTGAWRGWSDCLAVKGGRGMGLIGWSNEASNVDLF